VAALLLLAGWKPSYLRLAGAAAAAIAASVTSAMGLIVWPVGAMVLGAAAWLDWAQSPRPRTVGRHHLLALSGWVLVGAVTILLYFADAPSSPMSWTSSALSDHLAALLAYVLTYLGSPLLTYDYAYLPGLLGLVSWLILVAWFVRRPPAAQLALLPFVALGCYAVAGACLVALGRVQFGVHQALASRYVTFSYPFWVSLVALLFAASEQPSATLKPTRWWRAATRLALVGVAGLVVVCSAVGALLGYYWRYVPVQAVRSTILAGQPLSDEALSVVYPDPAPVRSWLDYLRSENLSLFAKDGVE
jgi:hypothetical protein